jgi:single stranded DNA-binding protein
MNQQMLTIMGRSTQDAQKLETKSGKEFTKFAVAVNEYRGKETGEVTTYFDVVSFSRMPKAAAKKVRKGDVVMISGRPEVQAYESKEGELKAKFSVNASFVYVYSRPFSTKPNLNFSNGISGDEENDAVTEYEFISAGNEAVTE